MCATLGVLREALSHLAAAFDARVLSAAEAERAVDDAAAIENMAATVKSYELVGG
jgi:hypothetical protein